MNTVVVGDGGGMLLLVQMFFQSVMREKEPLTTKIGTLNRAAEY